VGRGWEEGVGRGWEEGVGRGWEEGGWDEGGRRGWEEDANARLLLTAFCGEEKVVVSISGGGGEGSVLIQLVRPSKIAITTVSSPSLPSSCHPLHFHHFIQ
jgi:hypothetical protein